MRTGEGRTGVDELRIENTGPGGSMPRLVRDVMSAPAIACREEAYFEEVAELLEERDISGMPVVDEEGRVVGVISERDLAHALGGPMVRLALRRHSAVPLTENVGDMPRSTRRAKALMTSPAKTVESVTPLDQAAHLMLQHDINRLPVVDEGRLVGVVTRGDVVASVAHMEHAVIDLTDPAVLVGTGDLHPGALS